MNKGHSKYHSENAFCGDAGPEEMAHLQELIAKLSDEELKSLVENVGIYFMGDQPREEYEMVIDEAAREDFYRECNKILKSRT